jgi:hypothetical protein
VVEDHLGGGVAGGAAGRFEEGVFFVLVGEAEVDDGEGVVFFEQQVLGLDVAVHDAASVDGLEAAEQLRVKLFGCFFGEAFAFHDQGKELAICAELHRDVVVVRVFEDVVDFDDVRVAQLFQEGDFVRNSGQVVFVDDFVLFQDFYRHLLRRRNVRRQFHFPECAFAQSLFEAVVADDVFRGKDFFLFFLG